MYAVYAVEMRLLSLARLGLVGIMFHESGSTHPLLTGDSGGNRNNPNGLNERTLA